jgi:hypothetical protein
MRNLAMDRGIKDLHQDREANRLHNQENKNGQGQDTTQYQAQSWRASVGFEDLVYVT